MPARTIPGIRSAPIARFAPWILIAVIILVAAGLRFHGIRWDGGHYANPDELFIDSVTTGTIHWPSDIRDLLNPDVSTMNPRRIDPNTGQHLNFSYGTLLVYLLKAISVGVSKIFGAQYATMQSVYVVGRCISAVSGLITIFVLFLLGRRLFGARVGLLATAFAALSVLLIQYDHFYVAEPLMTMFLTLALLEITIAVRQLREFHAIIGGLLMGLAVGVKPSAAAFVFAGVLILLVGGIINHVRNSERPRVAALSGLLVGLRLAFPAGIAAVFAWAVVEPYAVMDFQTYLANIQSESAIQRGVVGVPYTLQYVGTVKGWYQLTQYVRFGVGFPLGIAMIAGLLYALYATFRRMDGRYALLLLWIAPYTISILTLEAKWLRYMIPISPVLLLLASALLWHWHDRLKTRSYGARVNRWVRPRLPALSMLVVVVGTALWAAAYQHVYTQPHPWVSASRWIYANVPSGSSIGVEHWDTALPLALPGQPGGEYRQVTIPMYDNLPPDEKLRQIEDVVGSSDYIVLASNRLYKSIPRLPWRYAVATRYYELLFDGHLGFHKVAQFSDPPMLWGASIDERGADDNVAVYDHPTVMIFRKERSLQPWEYQALFADALNAPYSPERYGHAEKTLMLAPFRDPAESGLSYFWGTWRNGPVAAVVWFLVLELLGLVLWLLVRPLMSRLPDRGWTVSKVLGMVIVSWGAWIVASAGLLPSTQFTVWLVLLFLLLIGLALGVVQRQRLLQDVRGAWRTMLGFDLLFLALYVGGILLRLANPDLWQPFFGGEKPMELSFINAILRSSQLPPYDPWFSGAYINYYYFGQWMAAELMRLASVPSNFGFNLADATILTMTGTMAACVGYTIGRPIRRRAAFVAAGLSWFFLQVIGNLDGAVQAVQAATAGNLGNLWTTFDFWRSTRLQSGLIHEFPFFTFLYGDLHAHMIAMPLGLTLVLFASYVAVERKGLPYRVVSGIALLAGLVIGAIAVTNPWDVFAYTGLFLVGLFVHFVSTSRRWWWGVPRFVPVAAIAGIVAAICYLPFFLYFESFYSSVGLVHSATPLWLYLDQIGLFAFIAGWYGVSRCLSGQAGRLLLGLSVLVFVAGLIAGHAVLALSVALLLLMLYSMFTNVRKPSLMIWSGLCAAGFLIWAGIEVFYLQDNLAGGEAYRMNTVFKFGLESWILLALGCAGLLYTLFSPIRLRAPVDAGRRIARLAPATAAVLLVIASLFYTVFGAHVRLEQRFPVPPAYATLNGEEFLKTAALPNESGRVEQFRYDYEAIQWMNSNIRTPRTIAEASIGPYRGNGSRISMFTGLPTVLGWGSHESQQRNPDGTGPYTAQIGTRSADVRDLYDSADVHRKLQVIEQYGIEYIYIGPVERGYEFPPSPGGQPQPYASKDGLETLRSMTGGVLRVVYTNPGVIIYQVKPSWQWQLSGLTG